MAICIVRFLIIGGLFIKERNMINSFENENEFLSNFYPSLFTDGTLVYPTVEHCFQASKTSVLIDSAIIAAAPSPGKAKRLGRKCSLRPDWEEIKDEVMYKALQKKFSIPELKEKLLNTGDEELEEGNWWHDNYWGNCHCIRCNNIQGKNTLGKMLMKLREELREE